MRKLIIEKLRKCYECLIFNEERGLKTNLPILVGDCMEKLGVDTVEPLTTTKQGNKFIFVATDYLTKFTFLKAVKSKSATDVAQFLFKDIILKFRCPGTILTDNEREYKNELIHELCQKLEINKGYSFPYRPETNWLVERTNQTLIAILAKNAYKEQDQWDKYIPII